MPELLALLFGLLIGSFLNVCIHRWPRDLSVVAPRSHCVHCRRQIAWFDNIPVVSFIVLRARCRNCEEKIHWRYPTVELLTGLCFAAFVSEYGLTLVAAKYCIFAALLIGMVFSDLDTLILPDQFTIGGFFIGMAFSFFVTMPDKTFVFMLDLFGARLPHNLESPVEAAFGGLFPAFCLWLMGWLFEKVRHKEGLGFGDVKMIAAIGAFLGIRGTLYTVIGGSVLGSIVGIVWIKATGKNFSSYQLPFGTFLGLAALVGALASQRIFTAY
ncbi:MAG: prepilin peptidase [Acidobacteriota bacterium]|nr:prepilin peptidase [Acidobacteriota bacterium]